MSNSDRIINELAERIRVVSGQQSFSFPIWFTDIVVGVRVGKGWLIYATTHSQSQWYSFCRENGAKCYLGDDSPRNN